MDGVSKGKRGDNTARAPSEGEHGMCEVGELALRVLKARIRTWIVLNEQSFELEKGMIWKALQ